MLTTNVDISELVLWVLSVFCCSAKLLQTHVAVRHSDLPLLGQ